MTKTAKTPAPQAPAPAPAGARKVMPMPYINRKQIAGYVGQDPEYRVMTNGDAVVSLTVATVYSYRDAAQQWQDITEWHPVAFYRKQAENARALLRKGSGVYIEGRMHTRTWVADDKQERRRTELLVEKFFPISLEAGGAGQTDVHQGQDSQEDGGGNGGSVSMAGFDTPES
ncbi:single-stranded DNA-binding protein [Alicycliphilus denitrificans]|uniref:single-stranded DNA-binding protein n=1 Tax=Alicycliphilus denitrificans TaxID=179636 RepID=UPI00384BF820